MMNPRSKTVLLALLVASVSTMVLAPGCEKKKPPPPPPPPPAVVEPVEVSFDSIMQTLKADARVQAAQNLGITDESFAQSAVKFADAFARGEAERLKGMMQNRAKGVLEGMESDGTWSALTPRIEAVRIVYAGSPGAVGDLERQQGIAQMRAMLPAQLKAFEDVLIKRGLDKNEMARFLEQHKLELESEIVRAQFEKAINAAASGDTSAIEALAGGGGGSPDNPEMAMLLAVQTPDGAELLGWTARKAGDSWIFNNASTLGSSRPKSANWDGVGMFGFSLGIGQAPQENRPVARPTTPPAAPGGDATSAPNAGPRPTPDGAPGERPKLPEREPRPIKPSGN